ncbi:MAG: VCBS repeat-containing protein, partial [Gammaproteobacteria bacterium]|nr:VCBS repeat-containing protein [Gammaproteobacteria bacterium]
SLQIWKNERGRFRDASPLSGLPQIGEDFFTGCTMTDYDRDGRLDLFATTYVAFSLKQAKAIANPPKCNWRGLDVFCGPRGAAGGRNFLFRNEGNGKFSDVSDAAGLRVPGTHYGLGAVATDFDDDGWPDIYVACDSTPSLLFHNQRNGTFRESAVAAGVAYGENGEEQGGMGVAVFDTDNDGRPDIVRTNFIDETTSLYRNRGELFFADETVAGGLALNTKNVSWGVQAVDFDQDGRRDLAIASGHIYPELGKDFPQPRTVYWNAGNGAFADVSAGEAVLRPRVSRGMAAGDLDGDGAPELVVVNQNDTPMVLKNETAGRGHWILLQLEGTKSNRSAIGAIVTIDGS